MGEECVLDANGISILLGPDYVPEGSYMVRLHDMSLNMTKDNDHHYIMIDFEITEGAFRGRLIKQIWSFRMGQEFRTVARINNFVSKVSNDVIEATDRTIHLFFNQIKSKIEGEIFKVWLIKNMNNHSEILYAETCAKNSRSAYSCELF